MWDESNLGGGFVTSPTKAGGPEETPQRKFAGRQNVVPCTIAQIVRSDEEMKLGSLDVQYVTVVGLVVSVNQQSTKVTFTIDDRTGDTAEGHVFATEKEEQTKLMSQLVEGTYARVVGSVRNIEGKQVLKVFRVFPVRDFNEVSMHMAEVVYAQLAVEAAEKHQREGAGEPMETSNFVGDVGPAVGLTKKQRMVYEVINSCTDPDGAAIESIYDALPSMKKAEVAEVMEFLTREGHIFQTFDDSHYKSTYSA